MRVPDELLKGSVFLVYEDGGQTHVGGTAFFLATSDPWCLYLVTARHCVLNGEKFGGLGVALNHQDGVRRAALWFKGHQWYFPESDADDVAVLPIPRFDEILPEFDVYPYFIEQWPLTTEAEKEAGIGVGDEVIACGLFTQRVGTRQNRPIIRSGIIAAMLDEPLQDRDSGLPFNAYLVEVRSLGGLSGSPVFVVLPPGRIHNNEVQGGWRAFFLLGLIRGHWEKDPEDLALGHNEEKEQFNTGIAMVTPIQRAVDIILNTEELVKDRKEQKKIQDKWDAPVDDSALGDERPITKANLERALRVRGKEKGSTR